MKRTKKKSFADELLQFLRKDPKSSNDFVYEAPFNEEDLNELFGESEGPRSRVMLRSGEVKKSRLRALDQEEQFIILENGERIPLKEIKEIQKD
jgi:hypothetical protein